MVIFLRGTGRSPFTSLSAMWVHSPVSPMSFCQHSRPLATGRPRFVLPNALGCCHLQHAPRAVLTLSGSSSVLLANRGYPFLSLLHWDHSQAISFRTLAGGIHMSAPHRQHGGAEWVLSISLSLPDRELQELLSSRCTFGLSRSMFPKLGEILGFQGGNLLREIKITSYWPTEKKISYNVAVDFSSRTIYKYK